MYSLFLLGQRILSKRLDKLQAEDLKCFGEINKDENSWL